MDEKLEWEQKAIAEKAEFEKKDKEWEEKYVKQFNKIDETTLQFVREVEVELANRKNKCKTVRKELKQDKII